MRRIIGGGRIKNKKEFQQSLAAIKRPNAQISLVMRVTGAGGNYAVYHKKCNGLEYRVYKSLEIE